MVTAAGACAIASTAVRAIAPPHSNRCFMASGFQRLVNEGWELAAEVGGVRQHLHHEDDHQSRVRIDAIRGTVGAGPPERPGRIHAVGAVPIRRLEAETE